MLRSIYRVCHPSSFSYVLPPSLTSLSPPPLFPQGALGWLLLSVSAHVMGTALALILLTSAASAVSDVVVDSMVVERARREAKVGRTCVLVNTRGRGVVVG